MTAKRFSKLIYLVLGLTVLVGCILLAAGLEEKWPQALSRHVAAGLHPRLSHYLVTGVWWGGLIGVLCGIALCAVLPFSPATSEAPSRTLTPRWFWPALLGICLLAVALRFPRLELSLYSDEEYTVRTYLVGKFTDGSEASNFKPVGWQATIWQNLEANNHVLYTVLARVALETWSWFASPEPGRFSATAIRLPSLAGGIASILFVALLLQRVLLPGAGLLAASMLALHPWHIRYSTEARGYGLMLGFAAATAWFLLTALREGRWRQWIGFALCQFGLLYSYVGSVYLVGALNLSALAFLLVNNRDVPLLRRPLRLIAANLFSLLLLAPLFFPCALQFREYFAKTRSQGVMGLPWLADFWSLNAIGMPWRSDDPTNPLLLSATSLAAQGNWLPWGFTAVLIPCLFAVGLFRLRGKEGFCWIVVAALLSGVLGYLHNAHSGNLLYIWYLLFVLPFLVLTVAAAFGQVAASWSLPVRIAVWSAFLLLYALATQPMRQVVMHHAKEPLLEIVRAIHGKEDPFHPDAAGPISAGFWTNAPVYDPHLHIVWNPTELRKLMRLSIESGRPLYITYGHRQRARQTVPDLLEMADDPTLFQTVTTYPGLEESQFTHVLLRFTGTLKELPQ